ncbi:carbohydrate ABC transporter permease [Paenibacillus sp. LHD-117]|uniref:carbohydrate ABC transporter permease n=1 Tax=Paenibacillus sp. LHD-117 TaxID=3071412 RepID=UPI0027DF18F9|nr:carbohydrate ABC transporter permease [Paenibacillus sp. LHD-117]MDQ6421870.1 carbohydrate ABC transporter permease [Paenibacillus sp. LHD-117]
MKLAVRTRAEVWAGRARRLHPVNWAKHWSWVTLRTILVVGFCFVILYPLFFKLSVSFKDRVDIYDTTVLWIPKHFTWETIRISFEALSYPKTALNSLTIAGISTLLQVVSCSLAAFGFARLRFKGSGILFACVIFTIIVPVQTIMITTYLNYRYFDIFGLVKLFTGQQGINLLDSYWPFILQSVTGMGIKSGLFIFIFRQFFRGIPTELEEASYIDGCSVFQSFYRIMLPNAVPAIVTVILFSFVWQWNDNYFVSLFLTSTDVLSTKLPVMWASFSLTDPLYAYLVKNAGELLFIAPIVLLYMFAQRYFVESVERSGLIG